MNYLKSFWNAIFLMTVAVSFCAFNASGATVNVQEVTPTYVGFVYGKSAWRQFQGAFLSSDWPQRFSKGYKLSKHKTAKYAEEIKIPTHKYSVLKN
jgi:hypothetical protein